MRLEPRDTSAPISAGPAADDPFGAALLVARDAAKERADPATVDARYGDAVRMARRRLRHQVAAEHVAALLLARASALAARRCHEYLAVHGGDPVLRLLDVECDVVADRWAGVAERLADLRAELGDEPLPELDGPLSRMEGLLARHHGADDRAAMLLHRSLQSYQDSGNAGAAAAVEEDLRGIGPVPLDEPPPEDRLRTPLQRLRVAEQLRLGLRYERALAVLEPAMGAPVDPALRFTFVAAKVRLLRLLCDHAAAADLIPDLYEAVSTAADPAARLVEARLLDLDRPMVGMVAGDPAHVRRLLGEGRWAEARRLLHPEPAPGSRRCAEWLLAAAEVDLVTAARGSADEQARAAAAVRDRLERCLQLAVRPWEAHVRIAARHALAAAQELLGSPDAAADTSALAYAEEVRIAELQDDDGVRVRMLRTATRVADVRVDAAAHAYRDGETPAAAAVVIGMEGARSRSLVPPTSPFAADLPLPSDRDAARRWIRRAVRGMRHDQMVWMMHATPASLHHTFVGRDVVRYRHRSIDRDRLMAVVERTTRRTPWTSPDDGPGLADDLDDLAELLGVELLEEIPSHVTRLVVVAGDDLADIPLAALPYPGPGEAPLVMRFAVSDLPYLALRRPLQLRSRRSRGLAPRRMLLLAPGVGRPLLPAREIAGRNPLTGSECTPDELSSRLGTGRYRHVRIDAHADGPSGRGGQQLQLHPDGTAGQLDPDAFARLPWDRCGTLVLGACESGTATRIGRGDSVGFVRSAVSAGAAAVIAARWKVPDGPAARILDDMEEHLRRDPRDVALAAAQRAEYLRDPRRDALAGWAAWTLHGDSGHQSRRAGLRALLRR